MARAGRKAPDSSSSVEHDKENGTVKKTFSKEELELARAALLNAVKDTENTRPLLNLFGAASSNTNVPVTLKPGLSRREQRQILQQALQYSMKQETARKFFASLKTLVCHVIDQQEFIPESAFENENENGDQEVVPDARSSEGLLFLYYATFCVVSYFSGQVEKEKQAQIPTRAYETAVALHDILDQLDISWGPDASQAQQAIVALCETWWLHNGMGKEHLIGQALPAIVEAAYHCTKSDIKRLFSIRSALSLIDFEDADSDAFLSLLMRVASTPACLKSAEGKRFLSHLFSHGPTMRRKLHQTIRTQIPENKHSILQDYGEVYFAAWKDAPDADTRLAIETEVLQDLMYAVIHASNPALFQSLLAVLSKFHDGKQTAEVEALLYRMYGPILWRALSAANAKVRVNGVAVLAQAFPLQDRSAKADPIQKGCAMLKHLLQDPDPRVRVAASEAVAHILTVYWDGVPTSSIRSLLNHLVAEHASDATSSAVRAGAVNAVTLMLEAPQSHAVLRELLPSLGNLIHDKVEKVRLAVVRMLLRIKKIPNMKYYHIVPLDHLAARFAEEGKNNSRNSVASALTSLMVNSYFPQGPNVESTEQIRRALKFLTEDPEAAAVFYANLSKYRSVDAVAKLTVQLLRCLHSSVEEQLQREKKQALTAAGKRRRFTTNEEKDNDDADNSEPLPSDVMANLAETIFTLWQSIEAELEGYDEWNQFLLDEFSGPKLTTILSYFESKALNLGPSDDDKDIEVIRDDCYRTCSAILRCAGRLPSKAVEGLIPYISSVLASVVEPEDQDSPLDTVTAHIALLCLWGMTDEVAPSLALSIQSEFREDVLFNSPAADSKKRRSGRPSTSDISLIVPQLPPRVALKVLRDILRGSDPSSVAAREAILSSKSACNAIETALEEGTRHAERILDDASLVGDSDAQYLLQVCEAFGSFALHKEAFANGGVTFSEQAKLLLHWTTAKVVPAFNRSPHSKSQAIPFIDPNLSSIQVEKSFDSFPISPEPVSRPRRRVNRNKTPERLDEGLGIFDDSPAAEEARRSASLVRQAVAVSLMNSSCVLFSEWLTVGGSGASFIAQAAADWCQIFEGNATPAETLNELAPAFCRLAIQLAKAGGDYSMMKQYFIQFNEGTISQEDTSVLRKSLTSLLTTRGTEADNIVTRVVQCVLDTAYELLKNEAEPMEFELPTSLGTLWSIERGCITSALSAIVGNQQASLVLAQQLVERFPTHVEETTHMALFDAKCLWILCDPEGGSKVVAEASEMVRQINTTGLEGELGHVVEELFESCKSM